MGAPSRTKTWWGCISRHRPLGASADHVGGVYASCGAAAAAGGAEPCPGGRISPILTNLMLLIKCIVAAVGVLQLPVLLDVADNLLPGWGIGEPPPPQ